MKVLFIIDGLRKGGKERRFLELVRHIELRKEIDFKVVLIHPEIEYDVDKHIKDKFIFITKDGKRSFRPFFSVYRIAKEYSPDFIHSWSLMVTFYSLPAVVFQRIRLLNSQVTVAPVDFKPFSYLGIICMLNFWFSYRIIANSKAGLAGYRIKNNRSLVIYNGFDFNRIASLKTNAEIRKAFDITTDFVIGMAATFSSYKDYNTFLKSAQIALTGRSDVTFLCIGGGDDSSYRGSIPHHLRPFIKFLGKQDDVESIMNICDIGVLSTYSEGISNSLLEFSALGKPILGTNSGGTVEIISNGENGFLIEPQNEFDLAAKIEYLLGDSNIRTTMGMKGVEIVRRKFGIERMIEEFLNVYQSQEIR